MDPTSITVAIPVSDLEAARAWYDVVLDRSPTLEPAPGIVEYEFGGVWVQLVAGRQGSAGWVLRYGVEDLGSEHARLKGLGVRVGDVETIPRLIRFFGFHDPDGNALSCYRVLGSPGLGS